MKKVSKIKKKFKGARYIANVLKKYFNKRYPTYSSALPKAKEILKELQAQGLRVNTKNIRSLGVAFKRLPKTLLSRKAPFLFYKLSKPEYYFVLQDYPIYIKNTSNEIFFVSDLFNEGVEFIQGGTKPNYAKTFSSYVNYVNQEIDNNNPTAYEDDYLVVCTPPFFNEETQRWESEIISQNANGEESDYGFSPTFVPPTTEEFVPLTKSGKKDLQGKKSKSQKSAVQSEEIAKIEAETEKTRQENLNMAMKLFLNKEITKTEYKEMVEMIKKNK